MATSYPASIDSFPTRVNGQPIDASHIDNLQDSVAAIEAELGATPKGVAASVAARIAAVEGSAAGLDNRVTTVEGSTGTLGTRLTTVEGTAGTLDTRLTTAEGTIGTHGTRLTTVEGSTGTLDTRLTAVEGTQGTQGTRLTTAEGTIGTLGTRLTTAEGKLIPTQWTVDGTNGGLTIGSGTGGAAGQGRLDVRGLASSPTAFLQQPATSGQALLLSQDSSNSGNILEVRGSDGVVRTTVDQNLNLVTGRSLFATTGVQVGAASATFGGGAGVLGITDATTVPTSNPTGGGILYSTGGAPRWRNPSGDVISLDGPQAANWGPEDQGFVAWAYDPALTPSNQLTVNGTVYLSAVMVRKTTSITGIWYAASTAGATATAGANWVGLYTSAGTRVAQAAADSNVTAANAPQKCTVSSTSLAPGKYWVALVFNAATPPTLLRTNGAFSGTNNAGLLTVASLRFATNATSQTTLPSSITTSSNVSGPSIWVAVS